MIKAVLYRDGENLTGCQLKGHSGWADSGKDICCAGASILTCTCVNSLESVCGIIPNVTQNDEGILVFELPSMTTAENEKAQILMKALKQGLTDLSTEFPQNVTLCIKERSKERRKLP